MKPLSETLTGLGIAFSFPIEINDENGNPTYYEDKEGWEKWERDDNGNETYWKDSDDNWVKFERDAEGNWTYCEYSDGVKTGTPRSTTNQ